MKFKTHFLSVTALLAAQSTIVAGKSGSDECPIDGCPSGQSMPDCARCQSSQQCHDDGWCNDGDMDCGCVAWTITYCGYANCNDFTRFVDGGIGTFSDTPMPVYFMIQGSSSESGKKFCWEVRGGSTEKRNKIVLGTCNGSDRQLFMVNTFPGENGMDLNTVRPKLAPDMIVVGVREAQHKAWLRLEEPSFLLDETQTFYVMENGMVGLGIDPDCLGDDCLLVTNQGTGTSAGDPVMLRTHSELMRFIKHGDVIYEWMFV